MQRPSGRTPEQLRDVRIQRHFTRHAEGSVLVCFGDTQVICTASVEEKVPGFLRDRGQGWVTAEYSMLPGASPERIDREAAKGKQSGRTVEIQRLIGRSLRAACDMQLLGERQVIGPVDVEGFFVGKFEQHHLVAEPALGAGLALLAHGRDQLVQNRVLVKDNSGELQGLKVNRED